MTAEADTTIPVVKTADREEITNKMQPDNVILENVSVKSEKLSLEEMKQLERKRKHAETNRKRAQAVNNNIHGSIPTLTLDMCRDPSKSLTQVVLRGRTRGGRRGWAKRSKNELEGSRHVEGRKSRPCLLLLPRSSFTRGREERLLFHFMWSGLGSIPPSRRSR